MRTYYDEDDDLGHDAYTERLLDRADYLRDEAKDREIEEAQDNTFTASSDAAEKPPVAKSPAGPPITITGELGGEAAGGYTLTDTADSIYMPTPEEDAEYAAIGKTYEGLAKAILATKLRTLSGREQLECRTAAGEDTGVIGFNCHVIDSLAIQFSREISEYINQQN